MSDGVTNFVSGLPKKRTPNNQPEDVFEIEYTGEWNYQIEAGGIKVFIDGYRGRTILEAKYVKNPQRSPFISGSGIPEVIRQKILNQVRYEIERIGIVIRDSDNPFNSLEVITNHPDSQSFFESLLEEFDIPGRVLLVEQ